MKKYECIRKLYVNCYDDDGRYEEKESVIEVGSVWIIEDEEDTFRMIGGEIRLTKEGNDKYNWLELNKDNLKEHFKLVNA